MPGQFVPHTLICAGWKCHLAGRVKMCPTKAACVRRLFPRWFPWGGEYLQMQGSCLRSERDKPANYMTRENGSGPSSVLSDWCVWASWFPSGPDPCTCDRSRVPFSFSIFCFCRQHGRPRAPLFHWSAYHNFTNKAIHFHWSATVFLLHFRIDIYKGQVTCSSLFLKSQKSYF
jgi:hypothetical protein